VTADEIRAAFLSYFEGKGHSVQPSGQLIPHNDPSLYFVNAGMVPFKDYFTGAEQPSFSRATSAQKCLRVSGKHNDLENVGVTPRHHTFFEMLGNFSFGDYFKADAIAMSWELLTNVWKVDADRLWVTVYEDDDEAWQLWRDLGFPEARLQRLGAKDNFWSMGDTGPCGPCSEIHYDHGPSVSDDERGPAGENDRYVEIWNLVFMQYEQQASGERLVLPKPSIDTGMGLERIAAVKQGVYSNYDTDLFQPLLRKGASLAGVSYGDDAAADTALRVIADHARASAFLVNDGVMPGNEGRAYVLRRIMRRALRFGWKLGLEKPFFHQVTGEVVQRFSDAYPELRERADFIHEVVLAEEKRFLRTLSRGLTLLDRELDEARTSGGRISGEAAFKLSDTYGFPLDLTQLIASEQGVGVDAEGFDAEMAKQKAMGRANWKGSGEEAVGALWRELADEHGATEFTGYAELDGTGTVVALLQRDGDELQAVDQLSPGTTGIVVLDRTPFYGESGGQAGDTGSLGGATVTDTTKSNGLHLHHVVVGAQPIERGDEVTARVGSKERDASRRNHTATHLLHAALRKLLGEHVTQKGSLVAPDRLRFDFSHHKPVSKDELRQIEDMVNHQIMANTALQTSEDDLEAAIEKGAMALFGEKYDAKVRVVSVPGFSVELCGGTHVARTGDIGLFKILSESGVAAGVRRLEAQTGFGALAVVREMEDRLEAATRELKAPSDQLLAAIGKMLIEKKAAERAHDKLKRDLAAAAAGDLADSAREIEGVKVLAGRFDGDLREQGDRLRDQLGTSLVVLAAERGPKVQLLVAASKDIAGKRVHCGNIVKELAPMVGGRGGGRPDMAQAGGGDPSGIEAMLAKAWEVAAAALGSA
jgi:alanyl-tRNA synthetase